MKNGTHAFTLAVAAAALKHGQVTHFVNGAADGLSDIVTGCRRINPLPHIEIREESGLSGPELQKLQGR